MGHMNEPHAWSQLVRPGAFRCIRDAGTQPSATLEYSIPDNERAFSLTVCT